jgi:hypothetical protein
VLLKNRSFLVFMVSSFLICIPLAFYYQTRRRPSAGGRGEPGFKMTFGQMSEIFFMVVMPFFFVRLGVKWMLAVGMLAWVARYALFAVGAPDGDGLDDDRRHPAARHLLRLLLRHRPDLHRQAAPKQIRGQAQGCWCCSRWGWGWVHADRRSSVAIAEGMRPTRR